MKIILPAVSSERGIVLDGHLFFFFSILAHFFRERGWENIFAPQMKERSDKGAGFSLPFIPSGLEWG